MANRVVRAAILESDKVNKLSWAGEVFYRRLMSVLDDFGRCDGRPTILRSKLYPLRVDKVSEPDIVKWISECETAGLVRKYQVDGKDYLEMFNFGQTVRQKVARVPPPDASTCKQMQADASNGMSETETETKTETITRTPEKVPRGGYLQDDCYDSGKQMFEEVKSDDQFMESLLRIVHQSGFISCQMVLILKAVKFFITREEAKPDFKYRPRSEHRKYLVNWITSKATTLNQYDK